MRISWSKEVKNPCQRTPIREHARLLVWTTVFGGGREQYLKVRGLYTKIKISSYTNKKQTPKTEKEATLSPHSLVARIG